MKFVEIKDDENDIKRTKPHHEIEDDLVTFMKMNIKKALVLFNDYEYCCESSCYSSLYCAIKLRSYPVKVMKRKKLIYLIRTDM